MLWTVNCVKHFLSDPHGLAELAEEQGRLLRQEGQGQSPLSSLSIFASLCKIIHHLCHCESGADPPPWRGLEQQGDERGASQLSHLRRRPPQCARFALPLLLLSKRKIVFYWTQLLLMPVVSLLLFCVALRALLRVGGGGDCAPLQEREQHLQVPKVSRRRHQKTGAWTEKNGRRKI